jgi:hypothetical protein
MDVPPCGLRGGDVGATDKKGRRCERIIEQRTPADEWHAPAEIRTSYAVIPIGVFRSLLEVEPDGHFARPCTPEASARFQMASRSAFSLYAVLITAVSDDDQSAVSSVNKRHR